ncbi:unnamed protein product [Fasciola hepatica]|uniref:Uncharacterized protein n=1 Tax=Fasciola hepatica TaxID=6192 RepID=A0ABC9HHI4_FASHE
MAFINHLQLIIRQALISKINWSAKGQASTVGTKQNSWGTKVNVSNLSPVPPGLYGLIPVDSAITTTKQLLILELVNAVAAS